jgi:UDP-N-acetylmuramate--alanine ligase
MWQHPEIAVITNIEFDHPDVYVSLTDVRDAFAGFLQQLSDRAVLITCGDDKEVREVLKGYGKRVVTYGLHPDNDYLLTRVNVSGGQTFFWVSTHGTTVGEFCIRVPGEHNALNALATIVVSLELGLSVEKIRKGLLAFRGSKRRLEFMGSLQTGAEVYDDYAHHPTELKKTLQALRGQYPKKNIVAIFQPHTYSRTKSLFNDFLLAFEYVDSVLVTDIYASLREDRDETISSSMLVDAMRQYHPDVAHLASMDDVVKYIKEMKFKSDTVLVTMGAGDIYKIHSELQFV